MRKRKLLSLVMAMAMVLSLLPATAWAEGTDECTGGEACAHVAAIGNMHYNTLAEAVAAVHKKTGTDRMSNTVITLLQDASGGGIGAGYQSISDGTTSGNNPVSFTLDLNGHTYTVEAPAVGSSGTETNGFQLLKDSVVVIKNGNINSSLSNNILIQNYSDLTLEDVNLTATGAAYVLSDNCGDVNIKGSTSITAGSGKVAFDVCGYASYSGVTVTVDTTGTITGEIEISRSSGNTNAVNLNVKNGNFVGTLDKQDNNEKTSINITGGTFTTTSGSKWDVSAYLPDGMTQDSTGKVVIDTEKAVASVNGVGYTTLAAAIAAAESGQTVTLLADVTLPATGETSDDDYVEYNLPKNAVLDLGGHTLTLPDKYAAVFQGENAVIRNGKVASVADYALWIGNGSESITTDITVENVTVSAGINVYEAKVTLKNVQADASQRTYYGVWGDKNSDITIESGTYTGGTNLYSALVYGGGGNNPGSAGKMTILGGVFQGPVGVNKPLDSEAQYLTVSGGTFSSNPSDYVSGNGSTSIIRRDGTDTYTYTVLAKSNLTAGTYLSDPTGATASNYYVTDNNNDTWTVSYSAPAGGNSSSGSSSTETTTNPDGSTTTTVTKPDGTVTETTTGTDGSKEVVETAKDGTVTTTTTDSDGNKTETVEKTDGSSETTVTNTDGSSSVTTVSQEGQVEAQVALTDAALNDAADNGQAVTLPMPSVPVTTDRDSAPVVTLSLPAGRSAAVEIPVDNVTPGTVAVLVHADGTEEVIKTSLTTENGVAVTLEDGATVKIVDNAMDFEDVSDAYWGSSFVDFATSRGLFAGTSETTFSPDTSMTRAMIVTVLASFNGVDTTSGSTWYEAGQQWAMEAGISDGSDMDGTLTREQLAVMLWRSAGSPAASGSLSGYGDAGSVSSWAVQAMNWAVENGMISGSDAGDLLPQGQASRVQVATILMRYVEAIQK